MQITINLSRGEQQQTFLGYLNLALRQEMTPFSGSAQQIEGGQYQVSTTGYFKVDQNQAPLTWTLLYDKNWTLTTLSVDYASEAVSTCDWEKAVHQTVTSALAATLSASKSAFFHRSLFFYVGPQLDGEYWLRGFRFAPALPGDAHPFLISAERPVTIDQKIFAIDPNQAFSLAEGAARRHAARLSLLLNTDIYKGENIQRWVWPMHDGTLAQESMRYHLGFVHPSFSQGITEMPKKGALCQLGKYEGNLKAQYTVAGRLLSLPREARKILKSIDGASPAIINAFDNGARLYQVALARGSHFPSVGISYRVAAIEAISKAQPDASSFSDFMRKYVSTDQKIDDVLEFLYGAVRSAHFHAGAFPFGEFDGGDTYHMPLMNAETVHRDSLRYVCQELIREAIVNWLVQILPDPEDDPDAEVASRPNT